MDLTEAKAIISKGYTLPCGHHNTDITFDYYTTYCRECGTGIAKVDMPPEFSMALQVNGQDFHKKLEHKRMMKANLLERMNEVLSVEPFATMEDFSVYLASFLDKR